MNQKEIRFSSEEVRCPINLDCYLNQLPHDRFSATFRKWDVVYSPGRSSYPYTSSLCFLFLYMDEGMFEVFKMSVEGFQQRIQNPLREFLIYDIEKIRTGNTVIKFSPNYVLFENDRVKGHYVVSLNLHSLEVDENFDKVVKGNKCKKQS